MDYDQLILQAGKDLGHCSAKKLERHADALKQTVARLQAIIDASQLPDDEEPGTPEPSDAVIADLVEIGRRAFTPKLAYPGAPDTASMAIHDAAPDEKTARAAYAALMKVLAAEIRNG